MQKLESMLDEWLVKKAPFQIPENGRKGLVSALPWLALIGGVLSLLAVGGLWTLATWTNNLAEVSLSYGATYASTVAAYMPMVWLSLLLMLAEAVIFFIAFPALRAQKKSGWNWLFWLSLLNVVYAVANVFVNQSIMSLLMSLLGSVIGLYLLFQVRGYYIGEAPKAKTGSPGTPASSAKK